MFNSAPQTSERRGIAKPPTLTGLSAVKSRGSTTITKVTEVMQMIRLIALAAFGFATSAMADGTIPEEYQGVWAAARDCKQNFQNVLSSAVNREFSACLAMQVLSSGPPESHTSAITWNCGGSPSREIWHAETIDGADYLVVIQFEQGATAGRPSIDMYKRCSGIPLAEIPLSEIPGNPVADTASVEKTATPAHNVQSVRHRPHPHSRAVRPRKHSP
jgi:hypothetical protein